MRLAEKFIRWPVLPVCLGAFILLAPVYLSGKALFWGTPLMQFVPWWSIAWESLLDGHLPLWNPLLGMGAPLLANYQSGLLYPPNWGYLLLWAFGGDRLMAWGMAPLGALHLAWAGAGMVYLARRLGLKPFSQAVSGLAFGLSGYLAARLGFISIQSAVAWLPWILALLTPVAGQQSNRRADFVPLAACLAMCLLAGHAQTAWYSLLLAAAWSAYWSLQRPCEARADRSRSWILRVGQRWIWLGMALMLAAGIAAAQLLPTAEYLVQSQRASSVEYDFALNYSFWPWHLLTLVAPGMFGSPASGDYWGYGNAWEDAVYVGLLPLILASTALLQSLSASRETPERRRLRRFLGIVFILALILSLGKNTPVFPWLYQHVPSFDMFQAPARWMIWAEFALALLAGLGAEHWRRPQGWGLYWTRLGTMGAFAIAVGAGLAWYYLEAVSPSFLRAAFILSLLGIGVGLLTLNAPPGEAASAGMRIGETREIFPGSTKRTLRQRLVQLAAPPPSSDVPGKPVSLAAWQAAALGFITLDLLMAGWGLNPGTSLELYEPAPNSSQVAALTSGRRVYISPADEDWLKYNRFLRFDTFDQGEAWVNLRAVMLPNTNLLDRIAATGNFDPLVPRRFAEWMSLLQDVSRADRQELLRLMDVGAILSRSRAAPFGVAFEEFDGQRLRLVPCLQGVDSAEEALRLILEGGLDYDSAGIVEGAGDLAADSCAPNSISNSEPGSFSVIDHPAAGPNQSEYRLVSSEPGWLVISDTWYPGWRAWLDGEPAELYRADYLFRAVHVPPGEHTIRMAYVPLSFFAGLVVSLLSLMVSIRIRAKSPERKAPDLETQNGN